MLGPGLRVLARAVRDEPGMFTFGVLGSTLFAVMTVVSAYVVGAVVGRVAVPDFAAHHVAAGGLALGAAAILAVAVVKVVGVFLMALRPLVSASPFTRVALTVPPVPVTL